MLGIFLIFSQAILAAISPAIFSGNYLEIEQSILERTINNSVIDANPHVKEQLLEKILKDENSRVNDDFKIPKYFRPPVTFWFRIYTQFTSSQVVIHDKANLDIIYNVLDFSNVRSSNLNKFAQAHLQSRLTRNYINKLRDSLKRISQSASKLSKEDAAIKLSLDKMIDVPKNKKQRTKFFRKLASNLRSQTGQRDMIYRGMLNVTPYVDYLHQQFELFDLPKDLLAISFLESSFNPNAESRVGAAGAWQFMPGIANLFMPGINSDIDYRLNPIVSTISALHLLRENKRNLKRWDFVVTAYNSGYKHLLKAKKKYANVKNLDLAYVIEHYKHPHLGFASKNFYSEFLALVHVLAYKESIFPLNGVQMLKRSLDHDSLNVYISKCSIVPKDFFSKLRKGSPKIEFMNNHFKNLNKTFAPGEIVVSDQLLSSNKYIPLSNDYIRKNRPKKWPGKIHGTKCDN